MATHMEPTRSAVVPSTSRPIEPLRGPIAASSIPSIFREALVCPTCRGSLDWDSRSFRCTACSSPIESADGVPVFAAGREGGDHDEIDDLLGHCWADGGSGHKGGQTAYFDRAELSEFEI